SSSLVSQASDDRVLPSFPTRRSSDLASVGTRDLPAGNWCVEDLVDEAGKIGGDILECFVVGQTGGSHLQRLHEAFRLGIVVRLPRPPIEPTSPCSASNSR